jgi:hypothetical protein
MKSLQQGVRYRSNFVQSSRYKSLQQGVASRYKSLQQGVAFIRQAQNKSRYKHWVIL